MEEGRKRRTDCGKLRSFGSRLKVLPGYWFRSIYGGKYTEITWYDV